MKYFSIFIIGCTMILSSCTVEIYTLIKKKYSPLDYREKVIVLGLHDSIPENSEELGTIKSSNAGISKYCAWDVVIDKVKMEARKIGGNVIKITEHLPPGADGSSCHRITAKILKAENIEDIRTAVTVDSSLINADYALLHVYRNSGTGVLINYDLYLGDSVICRVSNKWKRTIKIRKDGLNTLWARTEVKKEIPINVEFGKEYYVRCGITIGAFVGHPKLELVDNQSGIVEFQSFKLSRSKKRDLLIMNDGREVECTINHEDEDNVYFTIFKDNKKIKTQMNKSKIKDIQRSE